MALRIFAPALLITIGLFLSMTWVLHGREYVDTETSNTLLADFLMPDRNIETMRKLAKPDKPKLQQHRQPQLPETNISNEPYSANMPKFTLPKLQIDLNISLDLPMSQGDGDYMPLLKVAPLYPQRAARQKLEGYVLVEYTVTRSGRVRDVRVLEAKPAHVFNRAAIEAARKFKYKPKKFDGELVEVPGVRNKFTFRLEE